MRTRLAKDEGIRSRGRQNLVRFRPRLPGEISIHSHREAESRQCRGARAVSSPPRHAKTEPRTPRLFAAVLTSRSCLLQQEGGQPAARENSLARTSRPRVAAGRLIFLFFSRQTVSGALGGEGGGLRAAGLRTTVLRTAVL